MKNIIKLFTFPHKIKIFLYRKYDIPRNRYVQTDS